ncbi:MAG: carboxypeptidase regulatory-like domain-containing protein, partial [Planctomycetes bacterium]|nr:carboxypeptidase regulatory-like domain-containing protein [Planctomycetota bacterium]
PLVAFFLFIMVCLVVNHRTTYGQEPTPEPTPPATGVITGNVVDAVSLAGIADATVSTDPGGYLTATGPDGSFVLEVPAGNYTLIASATGYTPSPQPVTVEAGAATQVAFLLQPETAPGGASVFGFVTDPDENVLEGVVVTINGVNYSGETSTDVDGFFQFENVPAGDYALTFEFEGYQIKTQDISITEGQTEADLDVIIMEPIVIAAISGSVIDINGEPLESVKVKIRGIKTKFSEVVYTDADGFFEFTDLEADTYVIIANKKGYKRNKQKVTLGEGQQEELEIVLKKTK